MADMEDDVSRLTIVSTPSPTVVAEAESRAGLGSSSGVLVQPPSRSGSTSLRYSSGGSQASTARRLLTSPAPARLSAGSGGLMGGSFGDGDVYEQPNPLDPGKAFRLVNLRKADQGRTVCLRMVGKWKVCLNPVQKGKRHCLNHSTSKSYVFGSPSEWHTVAKPQRGTSGRSAFCLPRVHDNTILPGFRELVEEDSQTMAEWKLSFAEMEVAYEEHMASQMLLEEEHEDDNSPEEDESEESDTVSGSVLGALVEFEDELYRAQHPPSVLDPDFPAPRYTAKVDDAEPNATAIHSTRDMLDVLYGLVSDISVLIPQESTRVAGFVERKIDVVVEATNTALRAIDALQDAVGNIVDVQNEGHEDLVGAVLEALKDPAVRPELDQLRGDLDDVDEAVGDLSDHIDVAVVESGELLLNQIRSLLTRVTTLEHQGMDVAPHRAPQPTQPPTISSSLLTSSHIVVDGAGNPLLSLGEMIQSNTDLSSTVESLRGELARIQADLSAQGGIKFGKYIFTSELDVQSVMMTEASDAMAFACFLCPLTVFCHNMEYTPAPGWSTETKKWSADFTNAERKFVACGALRYPSYYESSGKAEAGKVISAFKSTGSWKGEKAFKGERERIADALGVADTQASSYIEDHLPEGKLKRIAESMLAKVNTFYLKLHQFLDGDLQKLVGAGLTEDAVLTLLSNYVIVIFDNFFKLRQKLREFVSTDKVQRLSYQQRIIWVTLQVHQEMAEFLEGGGFSNNSSLNAAYVRFITEEHGKNSSFKSTQTAKGAISDAEKANRAVARLNKSVNGYKTRLSRCETKLKLKPLKTDEDDASLAST